jgi:hypothetical protein
MERKKLSRRTTGVGSGKCSTNKESDVDASICPACGTLTRSLKGARLSGDRFCSECDERGRESSGIDYDEAELGGEG